MRRVYLDHNSTTPVDPEVFRAMEPFFMQHYGNPSNIHSFGRETREAIENARAQVAAYLHAAPEEIHFTSSGTEADNWAVKGVRAALTDKGNHIITSPIEHGAIAVSCEYLAQHGAQLSLLPVDETGLIAPEAVERLIRKDTVLVTVMLANNEIGTIEPVAEIARICRNHGVLCHTDAVAAAGKLDLDMRKLDVDLLTISAHKLYGPKGVGCLYIRRGTPIFPIMHGGHQEKGLRGGTENLTGIVGLGKACEIAARTWQTEAARLCAMRDHLHQSIRNRIEEVRLNGHPTQRLCNTLNVGVGFVEGESLLVSLDLDGVAVASGSACSAGESAPSATLNAINVPPQFVNSPLRISLGKGNTKEDIDYAVDVLESVVRRLRDISPIWKDRGRRFFAPPASACTTGDET